MNDTQEIQNHTEKIAELNRQLAEAQESKAQLSRAEIAKAAIAVIEARAEAEKKEMSKWADLEARKEKAKQEMIKKAEADDKFKAEEKAKQLLLEQEVIKLEAEAQERAKQRDEENRIQQQLFLIEQENKQRLANLQRTAQPLHAESDKPVTIADAGHPMAGLFAKRDVNGTAIEVTSTVPHVEEISYAEHQRRQAKLDAENALLAPPRTGPKSLDGNLLVSLQSSFKAETQEYCNAELMLGLMREFDEDKLRVALKAAGARHRITRMSVQGIITTMRAYLEGTEEIATPVPVVVQGELIACPICGNPVDSKVSFHGSPLCVIHPRNARSAGVISAADCEKLEASRKP